MKSAVLVYLILFVSCCYGQEVAVTETRVEIDTSVLGKWPELQTAKISADGHYVLYEILGLPFERKTLVLKSLAGNGWERIFTSAFEGAFLGDGKYALIKTADTLLILILKNRSQYSITNVVDYKIFKSGNLSRILYKTKDNTLALMDLQSGATKKISGVNQFFISEDQNEVLWKSLDNANRKSESLYLMNVDNWDSNLIWQGEGVVSDFVVSKTSKTLLYVTIQEERKERIYTLYWNGAGRKNKLIYKGRQIPKFSAFSEDERQMIFSIGDCIWYYQEGMNMAEEKVGSHVQEMEEGMAIDKSYSVAFSQDGHRLVFALRKNTVDRVFLDGSARVNIWSYTDDKLQSEKLIEEGKGAKSYLSILNLSDGKIVRVEQDGEAYSAGGIWSLIKANHYILLKKEPGAEAFWRKEQHADVSLVNLQNGTRYSFGKRIEQGTAVRFELSPKESHVIYYNPQTLNYYSYNVLTGVERSITSGIRVSWERDKSFIFGSFKDPRYNRPIAPAGIVGWMDGDKRVLIYDGNYDIWAIDPTGAERGECLTAGYCRSNGIKLTVHCHESGKGISGGYCSDLSRGETIILQGFSDRTKQSGLYKLKLDGMSTPICFLWGKYAAGSGTVILGKADNKPIYLLRRSSPDDAPNFYVFRDDSAVIDRVSNVQPQSKYRWFKTDLINWRLPNGENCQGILFKPEQMESGKKYPLIFNYYVVESDGIYDYRSPQWMYSSNVDIPYFVSRGYMVFLPDIHYKVGHTGKSAVASITSAAHYLAKLPYVDSKRMGLCGHSFGGYETNYIISHSNMFAAASEGAGVSDFISSYNAIRRSSGVSGQATCEVGQNRVGATLWDRPDLYLENSPILTANKVSTPLLILHNRLDGNVEWEQGVEFFTALRRLGKRAWMLEYANERHELKNPNNIRDYTIRLTQFFDHYLKDAPAPQWMVKEMPFREKGSRLGYELEVNGAVP